MEITLNQLDYTTPFDDRFVKALPPQAVLAALMSREANGRLAQLISYSWNYDFPIPDS